MIHTNTQEAPALGCREELQVLDRRPKLGETANMPACSTSCSLGHSIVAGIRVFAQPR